MAIELATGYINLVPSARGFARGIERELAGLDQVAAQAGNRSAAQYAASFSAVGKRLTAFVSLPLAAAGFGAFKFASDLNESISLVDRTFATSATAIQSWATTTATSLGIARSDALAAVGTFGQMFGAMGIAETASADMSTSLVTLASDMASAFNSNPVEVLENLRSGIVGEFEPLRKFGVVLSAAAVEEEALRLGIIKQGEEMSAAAKTQATYSLIMKQTAGVQGDFAATADEAANSQRISTARMKDAAATIGRKLMPVGTRLLVWGGKVAGFFSRLPSGVQAAVVVFGALAVAAGPVATLIGGIATAIKGLSASMTFLAANPIVLVIAAVVALVAGLVIAYQRWEGFRNVVDAVVRFVRSAIAGFVGWVQSVWESFWDRFGGVVIRIWELIQQQINAALEIVKGIIKAVTSAIRGDWDAVWDGIVQAFGGVWDMIARRVQFGVDAVVGFFRELGPRILGFVAAAGDAALSVGRAILDKIGEGLTGAANWVSDVGRSVVNAVIGFINEQVIDRINDMLSKEFDFGPLGSFTLGPENLLPHIPRLASGGVITAPTVALLGETRAARPEIAAPEPLLRDLFRDELARSAGIVQNNTFNGAEFPTPAALDVASRKLAARLALAGRTG